MKKYLIVSTLLLTLLMGCKLDDSVVPDDGTGTGGTSNTIVGKWMLQSSRTVGKLLGMPVDLSAPGTAKDYYDFKADGTVDVSSEDDGLEKGTYTYNATTRKLTMTKGPETNTMTISTINATTMTWDFTLLVPAIGTDAKITATFKR